MKISIYNRIRLIRLFCACAGAILLLQACEKDEINPPMIMEVRNYAASPNDTAITTLNAGQWVVLLGKNLREVSQVYFGSIPASINGTFKTDGSLVVQVPSIPFQSVPRDKLHVITVVSAGGSTNFEINITGAPVISYVRKYDAEGAITDAIFPDQQINIIGYNLKNATRIAFQGIEADLSSVVYTDSSAIVKVPGELSGGDASQVNMISYTNSIGTGTFSISIIGPPVITRVSYEVPLEGDVVYLYGHNFISIQEIFFAGTEISTYEVSADGTSLKFTAPKLTQSGPVQITTLGGTFTTAYKVNDVSTGIISSFEWGNDFRWDWWGGASLKSGDPDFPGNTGQYLVLTTNVLAPAEGADWSHAVRITQEVQWVPADKLSDPASSWALKFEIYIRNPWNGGTLVIKGSKADYLVRYEPWRTPSGGTAAYSTPGWQTFTIPLSLFRKNGGVGDPVSSLADLLGPTGKNVLLIYMHNYGTAPTQTGFYAAFDNFRVVRR